MILLRLFLTFLKIGAFAFGGGYGMIPMIRDEVLAHGWLTESQLLDFIAVSESTPGPIAVNMATFVGSSQGGLPGAVLATVGVILPAFLIILLITVLLKNLLKYAGVNAFLTGVRPVIAGLITATGITMLLTLLLHLNVWNAAIAWEWKPTVIFAVIALIAQGYRRLKKKKISPILLIVISAGLGILLYGLPI